MTPSEHFREAERLLEDADVAGSRGRNGLGSHDTVEQLLARAQVHATLATAAPVVEYRVPRHPTRPLPPPVLDGHGRDTLQETP